MLYNVDVAQQMRSYKLSRGLGDEETLNIMADAGWLPSATNAIKPTWNESPAACVYFSYEMLLEFKNEGCHSFTTSYGVCEYYNLMAILVWASPGFRKTKTA